MTSPNRKVLLIASLLVGSVVVGVIVIPFSFWGSPTHSGIRRQAPVGPLPLTASSEIQRLVQQAVLRRIEETPGRRFHQIFYSHGDTASVLLWPKWVDLPETVLLSSTAGECEATLGWRWLVKKKGSEERQLAAPPEGAIMRLHAPIKLAGATLPEGTLLAYGSGAWSVISGASALSQMKRFLGSAQPNDPEACDYRFVGALGAAVMGPPAQGLADALADIGSASACDNLGAVCAAALQRIGGESALPALGEMSKRVRAEANQMALEVRRLREEANRARFQDVAASVVAEQTLRSAQERGEELERIANRVENAIKTIEGKSPGGRFSGKTTGEP
jgi:hypothetical protein